MNVTIVSPTFFTSELQGLRIDPDVLKSNFNSVFAAGARKELERIGVSGLSDAHAEAYVAARHESFARQMYFNHKAQVPGLATLVLMENSNGEATLHMAKDGSRYRPKAARAVEENPAKAAAQVFALAGRPVEDDIVTALNQAYRRSVKVVTRSFAGVYIDRVGLIKKDEWIVTDTDIGNMLIAGKYKPKANVTTIDTSQPAQQ